MSARVEHRVSAMWRRSRNAEFFLYNTPANKPNPPSGFTEEAMRILMTDGYPGNVREPQNIVERARVLSRGPRVSVKKIYGSRMKRSHG
jgi:DNA-binding NtrC family response regulator